MKQKIVTIVGGSGFLGRYAVREFARAGWVVRVICRHAGEAEYLKPLGNPGQIVAMQGDLMHPHSLEGKIAGSDAVVNLVGILYEKGKNKFQGIHAHAAEWVAKHARDVGVSRYVHVSALGVDKAADASKYAKSKWFGEQWVKMAWPEAVVLRPSVMFGPEDQFFNRFARLAVFSPILPLIGGGRMHLQPVYVADVARAIRQAVEQEGTAGKTYELGGPGIYTLRGIFEFIMKTIHRNRTLVPLPFFAAKLMGAALGMLPNPLLTADQVKLLQYDNVASGEYPGFAELGISPLPVEVIVPEYLSLYAAKHRQPSQIPA